MAMTTYTGWDNERKRETIVVVVVCDKCGALGPSREQHSRAGYTTTARMARRRATRKGWHLHTTWGDRCDTCGVDPRERRGDDKV